MEALSRRRVRVAFLDHCAQLSGGEIALVRLLAGVGPAVEATVILAEEGPLAARLQDVGACVEVLPLDPRVGQLRKDRAVLGRLTPRVGFATARYVIRLTRRLRQLQPDIVHTNSLKSALYGGFAARLAGVPAIWHVRDRIADDYLPRPTVRLVRLAAHVLPSAIVANSMTTLATLPRARHSVVLTNPVVPDAVPPQLARDQHYGERQLRIGMLGRLAPWKGQHLFLEAFAAAFAGTGVEGRVIGSAMFGEDAYADELRDLAERLRIGGQVGFLGFRKDVWAELAQLDVLVHCSVTPEPFGQVVIEGMASGLAVVAAAAGGPAEVIRDGIDGLLVPPNDVAALTTALRRLAADQQLRTRLGLAAQVTSSHYSPQAAAARLLSVYDSVLSRRGHSIGSL